MKSFLRCWFASCCFVVAIALPLLAVHNNRMIAFAVLVSVACVWAAVEALKKE